LGKDGACAIGRSSDTFAPECGGGVQVLFEHICYGYDERVKSDPRRERVRTNEREMTSAGTLLENVPRASSPKGLNDENKNLLLFASNLVGVDTLCVGGTGSIFSRRQQCLHNTAGGAWEASGNWSLGTTPTSADTVFITNNGSYTVYVSTNTPARPAGGQLMTNANLYVATISGQQTLLHRFYEWPTGRSRGDPGRYHERGLVCNQQGTIS